MRSCCNRGCLGARALDASERFTTHGVKASWHARYTWNTFSQLDAMLDRSSSFVGYSSVVG